MAGVEQARAEAVSMLQGDPAKNNLLVQNNPGSYHQLHSNSSFAATRRMQHRKRFLRHHILREPVGQPGRQPRISILPPPAPELGVSFLSYDALHNCFSFLTLLVLS